MSRKSKPKPAHVSQKAEPPSREPSRLHRLLYGGVLACLFGVLAAIVVALARGDLPAIFAIGTVGVHVPESGTYTAHWYSIAILIGLAADAAFFFDAWSRPRGDYAPLWLAVVALLGPWGCAWYYWHFFLERPAGLSGSSAAETS